MRVRTPWRHGVAQQQFLSPEESALTLSVFPLWSMPTRGCVNARGALQIIAFGTWYRAPCRPSRRDAASQKDGETGPVGRSDWPCRTTGSVHVSADERRRRAPICVAGGRGPADAVSADRQSRNNYP